MIDVIICKYKICKRLYTEEQELQRNIFSGHEI